MPITRRTVLSTAAALPAVALLSGAPFASANTKRTYYVSESGSDAAAGTSESAPWKTVNRVNQAFADGTISHGDSVFFKRGERFYGEFPSLPTPSGSELLTLGLSVIIGEHPQSYSNTVRLFGKQRGSGETVWDIKRNIGYVSSQLHMDYRVNCSVLDVILSGFFDSIGVYQNIPDRLKIEAQQWLSRLNMEKLAKQPFRSLSWGQQRLLLIARAMVKHPPVLILDEPLQGLDGMNRKLVKSFIEQLVNNSNTQMLFVSHQDSDAPDCITHILEFIAQDGGYSYIQSAV